MLTAAWTCMFLCCIDVAELVWTCSMHTVLEEYGQQSPSPDAGMQRMPQQQGVTPRVLQGQQQQPRPQMQHMVNYQVAGHPSQDMHRPQGPRPAQQQLQAGHTYIMRPGQPQVPVTCFFLTTFNFAIFNGSPSVPLDAPG